MLLTLDKFGLYPLPPYWVGCGFEASVPTSYMVRTVVGVEASQSRDPQQSPLVGS